MIEDEEQNAIENAKYAEVVERVKNRYFNKNRREINRLRDHMYKCLIENNMAGYVYALRKLRRICLQKPLDTDVMEGLFRSSKVSVDEIVMSSIKHLNSSPEIQ